MAAPTIGPVTHSIVTAHLSGEFEVPADGTETYWCLETAEEGTEAWSGFCFAGSLQPGESATVEQDVSGLKAGTPYEARLSTNDFVVEEHSPVETFTTDPATPPVLAIDPVGSPTATGAHLSGTINPEGGNEDSVAGLLPILWELQFAPLSDPQNWQAASTTSANNPLENTDAEAHTTVAVEADASGLLPHVSYHARLVAHYAGLSAETEEADWVTFTTQPAPPTVGQTTVSDVTQTGATLHTKVNPGGDPTTVHFEYVTLAQYEATGFASATSTPESSSLGEDNEEHSAQATIEGLQPGVPYRYRAVATNSVETVPGETESLRTRDVPRSEEADTCPNAARRAEQHSAYLPDCRAYEMVSPQDKNGGDIIARSSRTYLSADGEAIIFPSFIGFGDLKGTQVDAEYMAERKGGPGTQGWNTHGITPLQRSPTAFQTGVYFDWTYFQPTFTPDLSSGIYRSIGPLTNAPNVADILDFSRIDGLRGGPSQTTLISDSFAPIVSPSPFFLLPIHPVVEGASTDLSHVVFETKWQLTPDAPPNSFSLKLFEWHADAADARQTLTVAATEGRYTLGFGGEQTPELSHAATAAEIQSALEGLGSIGSDNVAVAEASPGAFTIAFQGALGGAPQPTIEAVPGPSEPLDGSAGVAIADPGGHLRYVGILPNGASALSSRATVATDGGVLNYPVPHVVSDDGSHVFFTDSEENVYVRLNGAETVKLNAPERTSPESPQPAGLWYASPDGSRAYFITTEGLVEGDEDGLPDLYVYSANAPADAHLTLLSADLPNAFVQGVIGASDDGHYVYFMASTLTSPATIFVWHDGTVSRVADLASPDETTVNGTASKFDVDGGIHRSRVTPDGRHMLFMRHDSSGHEQLYLYSADSASLVCVSCNPTGEPATANARDFVQTKSGSITWHVPHALSDDGRYVFFNTAEALLPEDTNGFVDAYEYDSQTGKLHLLSSGTEASDSYFVEASADGHDVFIDTQQRLLGWDHDGAFDMYDVRIDGGFPEPPPVPTSCGGESCRSTAGVTPTVPVVGSAQQGAGNPRPAMPRCAKGRFAAKRHGKTRCVKRKHKSQRRKHHRANADRRASR